jgi:hypothetical protein
MAVYGKYNPSIIIHEVLQGNTFNGALPNVALDTIEPEPPYYTGRVNFYGGGTSGGLIESTSVTGFSIDSIIFRGAGTTRVTISIENTLYPKSNPVSTEAIIFDTNNQVSFAGAINTESFVYQLPRPLFVQPSAKVKLVSVGNLTAVGRAEFRLSSGWGVLHMQGLS